MHYLFPSNDQATLILGGYFTAEKNWQHFKRSGRDEYEFIICEKGPLFLEFAGEQMIIKTNEIAIVPPLSTISGYRPSPNEISFYWLHIKFQQAVKPIETHQFQALLTENQNNQPLVVIPNRLQLDLDGQLIIFIHQLLNIEPNAVFSKEIVSHLINVLLLKISSQFLTNINNSLESPLISHLKEWIRINLQDSPTLADLAAEANLNPQYLSRLFKKEVGYSPKKYMLRLKLQIAEVLLLKTSLSIKEVAHKAYFPDEKLFMIQFKQHTGLTPSQYRKSYNEVYHNNAKFDSLLFESGEGTEALTHLTRKKAEHRLP